VGGLLPSVCRCGGSGGGFRHVRKLFVVIYIYIVIVIYIYSYICIYMCAVGGLAYPPFVAAVEAGEPSVM